uniref:RNA polymerase I subunit E n=1 Tax=Macaca nemestrina TaxID=9545 RepID=A0A2K6DE16_MACNE
MAAEVLPSARWQYCGAPDGSQRAVLVQFSNGKLQSPGNMRFTLYENKDSTNPRKRNQRILAAETDRLSYVGNNFGTGALKCNTLCRSFTYAQMECWDLGLDSFLPLAEDDSLYLPPCYDDATKPEDVYKFEDLLSPAEYEALQSPSEAFRNVTSEEILKMIEENSHCTFVIEALKSLPSDVESRDRQARCIWFLDTLIKFRAQRVVKRKSALGPGVPHIINTKLLKHFTCLTYNNGRLRNLISDSMKAKITAYVIILALHIHDFQIDLTMLQGDLKLSEKRMMEIAKAMRLKISKRRVSVAAGSEEDHKLGTLSLPLPPAQTSDRLAKRRKIT